jgi:hypothetical protein
VPLRRGIAAALAAAGLVACAASEPAVQSRRFSPLEGALDRVAVAPFRAREAPAGAVGAAQPADALLVARFVGEALSQRGLVVIPPGDLERVLVADAARFDPAEAAFTAAREFGATSVLMGEVLRYREGAAESGEGRGASVAFSLSLYDAPSARRLWSARFDETQQPLSANVLERPSYPGHGTRWLAASELARWGADVMADQLLER